jgi:signal transduction histidine kinase
LARALSVRCPSANSVLADASQPASARCLARDIPVRDGQGGILGRCSISTDGTGGLECFIDWDGNASPWAQADAARARAEELVDSVTRMKTEFLAVMSHEVRTPLNGIYGMLQLLAQERLDAEQRLYVETAVQSCQGLTRFLGDLLDMSLADGAGMPIHISPFDLVGVVRAVAAQHAPVAEVKGLRLDVVCDPALPRRLGGDEARVRQILTSLLGNAVKCGRCGEIRVHVSLLPPLAVDRKRVLLAIFDPGEGGAADRPGEMPSPLGGDGLGHGRGGGGLGLTITRHLVTRMGGSLAVNSETGIGMTVYCCLPFAQVAGDDDAA